MPKPTLEQLRKQKEALDTKIAQHLARNREAERKKETRRKIVVGATVITHADKNPTYKAELMRLLDAVLIREDDRALFGLRPVPKTESAPKAAE